MNPQPRVPNCSNCDSVLIPKESKKTGDIFFTCPNWKPDGSGCKGDMYFPPKEKPTVSTGTPLRESQEPRIMTHEQGEKIIQILLNIETKLIGKDIKDIQID